jgi:hypothetical protein
VIGAPAQARALAGGQPAAESRDAAESDDTTPFDVPAFLRRQQG